MRREFLTDEEVESEITRLTVTPEVKLMDAGITIENIDEMIAQAETREGDA